MDLDSLITSVQSKTGRTDKDDVAEEGLRFAFTKISQLFPFDQLTKELSIPTVAGDTQIQLPANLDEIIEARLIVPQAINMSYKLDIRRKTWFVTRFPNVPNTVVTGRPYWCYREIPDNTLHYDRVCNGSYTIKLTAFSTGVFLGGADSSPLTGCDECLMAYGVKYVYESIQMYQDAQYWNQQFSENLSALVTQKSRDTGVHYIAEEWSWHRPVSPNQPWLDPFQAQGTSYSG